MKCMGRSEGSFWWHKLLHAQQSNYSAIWWSMLGRWAQGVCLESTPITTGLHYPRILWTSAFENCLESLIDLLGTRVPVSCFNLKPSFKAFPRGQARFKCLACCIKILSSAPLDLDVCSSTVDLTWWEHLSRIYWLVYFAHQCLLYAIYCCIIHSVSSVISNKYLIEMEEDLGV